LIEAGVDEAGRGPLAGPVVAAAVILKENHQLIGLNDSKKLSSTTRESLSKDIKKNSVDWSFGHASSQEIDEVNILQASLLAMERAVLGLTKIPNKVLVDGQFKPKIGIACEAIIGGDTIYENIMAASILAKVERDRIMIKLNKIYPVYGFDRHKGYPTKMHLEQLKKAGPCEAHRTSFKPVKQYIK
tara:strand:+ start:727 stop:1287 length:561 start_codon:yes stop_codon:yes gene_type:complete